MKTEILVDSKEFWPRFRDDIAAARKSVYVQTLSFEGDATGWALAQSMMASSAPDKKIIVDYYTKYVLSDKFLYSPKHLFDTALRHEKKETARMIRELEISGTPVRFVSPVGTLLVKFPSRNHKKILIVDDNISYIGGINFSDHNFAWHDLMVRIEHDGVADFLRKDFLTSWEGREFSGYAKFDGLELYSCNGRNNKSIFEPILSLIDNACETIYVQSPYLSFPFSDKLSDAVRRNVKVMVVTPERNNKKQLRGYIFGKAAQSSFDLHLYPGMTHLKAMLIDGKYLIVGSSNFDDFSYRFEQETMAVITDTNVISDFVARIVNRDNQISKKFSPTDIHWSDRWRDCQLKLVSRVAALFNGG